MKTIKKTFLAFMLLLVTLWPVARSVAVAAGPSHPAHVVQAPIRPQ